MKKKVFFVPLMFIGMGIGFILTNWNPEAFLASMFIGMGIGFLLDSLFTVEAKKIEINNVYKGSSIILSIIGLILIITGALILISPNLLNKLKNYLIGIGIIIFGLFILIRNIERLK